MRYLKRHKLESHNDVWQYHKKLKVSWFYSDETFKHKWGEFSCLYKIIHSTQRKTSASFPTSKHGIILESFDKFQSRVTMKPDNNTILFSPFKLKKQILVHENLAILISKLGTEP